MSLSIALVLCSINPVCGWSATFLLSLSSNLSIDFEMTALTDISLCLQMEVKRNRALGEILHKFNMHDCRPTFNPTDSGTCSELSQRWLWERKHKASSLLIRPGSFDGQWFISDLAFAISSVAKHSSNPGFKHWIAVKRIFRYIQGTITNCSILERSNNPSPSRGFSGADWGRHLESRRS